MRVIYRLLLNELQTYFDVHLEMGLIVLSKISETFNEQLSNVGSHALIIAA